jgi:predicted RecB family endonuclease
MGKGETKGKKAIKAIEEMEAEEMEEYFAKRGTDLKEGIARIIEMVERHKSSGSGNSPDTSGFILQKERRIYDKERSTGQ